jgi:hypothetical protein
LNLTRRLLRLPDDRDCLAQHGEAGSRPEGVLGTGANRRAVGGMKIDTRVDCDLVGVLSQKLMFERRHQHAR